MNKIKCIMLVAFAMGSTITFAAKDSNFHFQNSVRVGYDDNVYASRDSNKQESTFISDIVNISGDLVFSDRSNLELFWQPELRYRFDADPKAVFYNDLYGRFSHAMSQRTILELSDRFRYQDKGGQSDLGSSSDQNYLQNDLMGALDFTLNDVSRVKVGAGYDFRLWDDDYYGETVGNNFDQYKADGSYIRQLKKETTYGLVGANYVNHEYEGTRGGFNSTTIYGGADHNFNPNVVGTARLGYSFSTVESSFDGVTTDQDSSSPYLQAGLDYNATERTTFTSSLGYSLTQSENSIYNATDAFDLGVGVRHDLTGKINLSSTLRYVYSLYDAAFTSYEDPITGLPLGDAKDNFLRFSIRGSYQINRNNFVDLGYEFTTKDSDSVYLQEYDRNRVDIGWRLRF